MNGYAGNTSFDFEIERYKNKETGTFHSIDEVEKQYPIFDLIDVTHEYIVINLEVEGRSYYERGRSHGLPEDCYPDEGDTEIMSVIGPDGKDWTDKLTASEELSIIDMIQQNVIDGCDGPDPDDYHDDI